MSIYDQIAKLPPEKRAVLEMMLQEQGVDLSQMPILPRSGDEESFPLSFAQQRLWFLDQLEPGSPLYNICSPVRITGELNVEALRRAFELIVNKHEVLRTTFFKEGAEARQKVHSDFKLDFEIIDHGATGDIHETIKAEAGHSFNLRDKAPIRVRLFRQHDKEHVLVLTLHHIVSDNWSTGVLIKEFMELYPPLAAGKTVDFTPLTIQYADFAAWQRKWLSGKTLQKQLDYWTEKLDGLPPVLDLPTDFPRPAYQSHNGDYITFQLDTENTAALKKLADAHDVTLFMALMAAFEILMLRYSGQDDFAVGTPIANRNRAETEPLIGFFINTLVIRADVRDNPSVATLLKRVKETMIGAYGHQDLPFETLVEKLDPERSMSHSPLFQTMLVFNNAPVGALKLPGVELELLEFENKTTKFDLIFNFTEQNERLDGKVEYNTDLFKGETVKRMIRHFERIVREMSREAAREIELLPLLSSAEQEQALHRSKKNSRRVRATELLIPFILAQCELRGEKTALRAGNTSMSYAGLRKRIYSLRKQLRDKHIQPGQVVAVLARRSPHTVAAMLAVMGHGAVYLPIDPSYPRERLQFMLEDSGAVTLMVEEELASLGKELFSGERLTVMDTNDQAAAAEPGDAPEEEAPAYLIYTSGSTGKPKGVLVSHRAMADHTVDMTQYFTLSADDVTLQFAAMNFDASLEQILSPLLAGATIVMRDEDIWPVERFAEKINEYGLTVVNPTTAYWNLWCAYLQKNEKEITCPTLRLVISGGDAMSPAALKQWWASPFRQVRLINAYGPTETVITATCYDVPADETVLERYHSIPIGTANANRELYVLDNHRNLLPPGLPGELCIAGDNLALGYLNRPEEESAAFVPHPFAEKGRMYRTGDKVRLHDDGNLEFMGRVDQQVKIRGFRIEPGEVENILAAHPDLDTALVAVKRDGHGEKQLVGYFRPHAGSRPEISALRDFLQKQLPPYMVPAAFIELDTIPMLPGGKVNRRALPVPEDLRSQLSAEYVAPRTETEEELAAIVASVLRIEKVGVYDNFFELGGHSMLGTQVMSLIQEKFAVEVPLRVLFENPTVDGIAAAITEALTESLDEEELADLLGDVTDLSDDDLNALLNED